MQNAASRLLAQPCPGCGGACKCGERFIYRSKDEISVFTGIVVRSPGDKGTGFFKLSNPADTTSPAYELGEHELMIDFSAYDNCSWPAAPNRDDDLLGCICGLKRVASKINEFDELLVDDSTLPLACRVRVDDAVRLCTNFPNDNGVPVRETFWATVLAVHTFGKHEQMESTMTVLPLVDKWMFIDASLWDPDDPFVCKLSRTAVSCHGDNW